MGKYELVKPVNKDLIINPQKNFEIQQSAPLSAADIQALLSIDPDNQFIGVDMSKKINKKKNCA